MMKEKRIRVFSNILSIVAPLMMLVTIIVFISYGWYIKRQQTANIDASTKNVAVEYTFDEDETKNVLNYTVSNLVFFDENSNVDSKKIELKYIYDMAVLMTVNLKNNSSNDITYKLTFASSKEYAYDDDDNVTSIAYISAIIDIDDILDGVTTSTTTVAGIRSIAQDGVTYTNTSAQFTAEYDSGYDEDDLILLAPNAEVSIDIYLFGVQEIDSASNDDFLYELDSNDEKVLKNYLFSLTISSVPVGDEVVTEVTNQNSGNVEP